MVVSVLIARAVAHYDQWLPHKWQTYTAPDGTFSLDLPAKPSVETIHMPGADNISTAIQSITAQPTDNTTYTCTYFDRQSDPGSSPQQILQASLDGSLKKIQGTLISQKELTIQGYPALDALASARGNSLVDYRMILANGRMFLLKGVAMDATNRDPKTFQRFKDSFKILRKPCSLLFTPPPQPPPPAASSLPQSAAQ